MAAKRAAVEGDDEASSGRRETPKCGGSIWKIVFFYSRLSYYTCTHMEERKKTHGKKQNYEFSGLNISYP